jgi:glycerophosphoryl diester phosphodiesterase
MIELDVTLTQDRKVVVIHDDTLDRTTNGRGLVREHTLAHIKQLDAGSWFDERFSAQCVPELSEVMALAAGRCLVNIEIKTSGFDADDPADAIERQVVSARENKRGHGPRDYLKLRPAHSRAHRRHGRPAAARLYLRSPPGPGRSRFLDCNQRVLLSSSFTSIDREQLQQLHAAGLNVFPWTINTRKEAEELRALGVDGLICNELRILRSI